MPKYAIKEIEACIGTDITVYKLIVDDNCEFDEFENKYYNDPNYEREFLTLITRLEQSSYIGEKSLLPETKFKDITPEKDPIKEYEVKTHNLRLYLFKFENRGRIVVCGGRKDSQKKDLRHFRNIKTNFLEKHGGIK